MKKEFLPYDVIRNNALKLAQRIYRDGFVPDVIYVSLRGGAYLGNVISEYFKVLRREGRPVYYAAVVARSYTGVRKADKIKVEGWTVHDYKFFYDQVPQLPVHPDYWCRKHELSVNDEDHWIHYMSHELVGLSPEELEQYYYSQDPELRQVLDLLHRGNAV